jgi:hypothetical protein
MTPTDRWLMSPKPADRPSAREVLQSDLLPPVVEDEQLKDLLRSLPNNPTTYERVVEAVFATATTAASSSAGGPAAVAGGADRDPDGGAADGGGMAVGSSVAVGAGGVVGPLALGELPGVPLNVHVDVRDAVTRVVHDVFK